MSQVVITYRNYTLRISREPVCVHLQRGTQGPAGPPGAPGGQAVQMLAGQTLSAGRAVVAVGGTAYYFQPSDPTHVRGIVGVTKSAANAGDPVDVQVGGIFEDIGLSLTPDAPVFVSANGVLTSTPASSGLWLYAGVAITSTRFLLNPSFCIVKN